MGLRLSRKKASGVVFLHTTCRPAGHPSNIFSLQEGYQWSLNVVFAELAVNYLGADALTTYAQRFGYSWSSPGACLGAVRTTHSWRDR